jgi:hypothetical protein
MRGGDSDITLKERRSEEEESEEENPKLLHRYLLVWLLGLTERDYHWCFFFLIFQFLLFLLCFALILSDWKSSSQAPNTLVIESN